MTTSASQLDWFNNPTHHPPESDGISPPGRRNEDTFSFLNGILRVELVVESDRSTAAYILPQTVLGVSELVHRSVMVRTEVPRFVEIVAGSGTSGGWSRWTADRIHAYQSMGYSLEDIESRLHADLFRAHGLPFLGWCLRQSLRSSLEGERQTTGQLSDREQETTSEHDSASAVCGMLQTLPVADPHQLILDSLVQYRGAGCEPSAQAPNPDSNSGCRTALSQVSSEFETRWTCKDMEPACPDKWVRETSYLPDADVMRDDPRPPTAESRESTTERLVGFRSSSVDGRYGRHGGIWKADRDCRCAPTPAPRPKRNDTTFPISRILLGTS